MDIIEKILEVCPKAKEVYEYQASRMNPDDFSDLVDAMVEILSLKIQ